MKNKMFLVITIIFIAVLVVGATYSYFAAQVGEGKSTDIEISTNTVDTFSFAAGDPLKFTADQFTFAEGGANISAETYAKAILTANNKTNTVAEHYYLYLNILNNTFGYSQDSSKPELLLQITDKSGNAVTSLTGLEYKTVSNGAGDSISGFDVTTKNGLITILNNREITTTSTLEEQWNVTLTFVNYEFNQASNGGKSFSAKLMIQKGQVLTEYIKAQYNGVQGNNDIYFHDSSLINGAGDNSYRYAGASPSNFVCFGSNVSTCPIDNLYRIIGVIDGKVKLIKYDYMTVEELGTDGDYFQTYKEYGMNSTYKGKYGDGEKIGTYYWNYKSNTSNYKNNWSESLLNKTNLNTNFINYLKEEWTNKIATTTWKVGGNLFDNIRSVTPAEVYQNEIITPANNITYDAKIGLMYVSDYAFAASSESWTKNMSSYGVEDITTNDNWMYMGLYEWTITRIADNNTQTSFLIMNYGLLVSHSIIVNRGVRAVFSLEPSVSYKSGDGTFENPIRIN